MCLRPSPTPPPQTDIPPGRRNIGQRRAFSRCFYTFGGTAHGPNLGPGPWINPATITRSRIKCTPGRGGPRPRSWQPGTFGNQDAQVVVGAKAKGGGEEDTARTKQTWTQRSETKQTEPRIAHSKRAWKKKHYTGSDKEIFMYGTQGAELGLRLWVNPNPNLLLFSRLFVCLFMFSSFFLYVSKAQYRSDHQVSQVDLPLATPVL